MTEQALAPDLDHRGSLRSTGDFVSEFVEVTGLYPTLDESFGSAVGALARYLATERLRPIDVRRRRFLAHVRWKFRLNADHLRAFYGHAASRGVTFNYPQKAIIQDSFDSEDRDRLQQLLSERGVSESVEHELLALFRPVSIPETIERLRNECHAPSRLRRDLGDRDIASEIIKAQFAAFMWVSVDERRMHAFFDPDHDESIYRASFWEQLQVRSPQLFNREHSLEILRVTQETLDSAGAYGPMRDSLTKRLAATFTLLNNYGHCAVVIEPLVDAARDVQWELAADLTLFAEKHRYLPLLNSYFQPLRIQKETHAYIPDLDPSAARFDLANEGFTYKDCFVVTSSADGGDGLRLVLVFQKNQRDETLVPCPTCRSTSVQGNSYSSLGVRSWECENPLCPDRSKYNRGKRYSFRGLAMQQAIDDPRNEIPSASVRRWVRDVVTDVSAPEIFEMLVRHYSMADDTVHVANWDVASKSFLERLVVPINLQLARAETSTFWSSPIFQRYVYNRPPSRNETAVDLGTDGFSVLHADSASALQEFQPGSFDVAITSPPYFNAREYSQWPNVYCYLYDLFNVTREVYRTLKAGAYYWFNLFDYFDNENTTVFSAMGEKRMILSAYVVDLFRRVGFESIGNVVWDKGDIQGKRGFNAGNFSPYYQSPFNCWEHILVFRKPNGHRDEKFHSRVWRQSPVIKMVRGRNVHGHSAPFPDALPELAIKGLAAEAVVLDPYAGSLTTGRVAARHGLRSVSVEILEDYCRLGLNMQADEARARARNDAQLRAFDS